jgi:hypothetical protein
MLMARAVVFVLAVFEILVVYCAGIWRARLGWKSGTGNFIWFALTCPGTLALWFAQQLIYWRIVAHSPYDDLIASVTIIGGGVVTACVLFYTAWKYGRN